MNLVIYGFYIFNLYEYFVVDSKIMKLLLRTKSKTSYILVLHPLRPSKSSDM
jgi:hypothetical protein